MTAPRTGGASAAGIAARFGTVTAIDSLVHLQKEMFDRVWAPRWYPADFLPFDPAVQVQMVVPVQIADDRDFVCMGGTLVASNPAAPATFFDPAPYTCQIRTAGQTALMSVVQANQGFVHVAALFSRQNGADPAGRWPVAQWVPRNTTVSVVLNVLDAISRDVRVSLYGFDVY